MVSSSWDGEGLDDWENELERPDGRPALALMLGSGAIVMAAVAILSFMTVDITQHVLAALGLAALGAAAVFAIAWFLTLRHASTGWKVFVGVGYIALALLAVALAVGAANVAVRMDVAALQTIRVGADGQPSVPPGTRRGPIVQLGLTYYREMLAERNKRESLLVAQLGLDRLTNATALASTPQLLRDCDRFARAKPALDTSDRHIVSVTATFRTALGAQIQNELLRREAFTAFDKGFGESVAELKQMSAVQHAQLDAAGPLCSLLARKNWVSRGNLFEFSSQGDLNAFNAKIEPWNDLVRRQNELLAQSRARTGEITLPTSAPRF